MPADWHTYNRTCKRGHPWHESEGGCGECAEMTILELQWLDEEWDGGLTDDERNPSAADEAWPFGA